MVEAVPEGEGLMHAWNQQARGFATFARSFSRQARVVMAFRYAGAATVL